MYIKMFIFTPLFFGFIASIGALFFELFVAAFGGDFFTASLTTSSLSFWYITAIIEECMKYFMVYKLSLHPQFKTRFLASIILFSLGFSALESVLALSTINHFFTLQLGHILAVILFHFLTILLYGYALSKQWDTKAKSLSILLFAIALHIMYNTFVA